MSKSAVGQFSTSNVLLEDSQVQLSFPAATDKNGETVAYYAKIYWQPIYCSVSGANYISIETTDTVRVNMEIPLTVTGSATLQSTIALNFDNKLSTDVRIYVVVTARDGINDHPDDPPVLTSGYYYVIRHQIPTLALSSAEWVPGAIREVQLNGSIVDYGFTTPGNLVDLLATDLIWQAWRTGLETALGSINLTFNFKIAYSSDNINFSTPATYDITVIKELINATPGNAAYTNDLDFSFSFNKDATIPIPIESITQENSYFFKAYISSSHFTLNLDSNSTSILLTSNTPLFVMRNGIIQINLPKATTAKTGAIIAARGPQQDVIDGQSLALYDLHTESGQSEVANSPSIGFFDNLHNLMAAIIVRYNDVTDMYEAMLDMNGSEVALGGLSGIVNVSQGGTGLSSLVAGSFLVGKNATTMETKTAAEVLTAIAAMPLAGGAFTGAVSITHQLTSTVAVGTAPFVVTSTTKVDNLNAALLDGVSRNSFLRSDTTATYSGGILTIALPGDDTGLGSYTNDAVKTINLYQETAAHDAFLSFRIGTIYGVHFGLDYNTNDLFVGGWTMGAVKNKIWHAGNDGSGSGLDSDLLDGRQATQFAYVTVSDAGYTALNSAYNSLPSGIYKASDVPGVGWAHIINCAHQHVDGYGSQIMLGYQTTGSMWFRSSSGETFSAWHRLWHDADFYFQTS